MNPEEASEALRILDEVGAVSPEVYRRALKAVSEQPAKSVAWVARWRDDDEGEAHVVYAATALGAARKASKRSSVDFTDGDELAEGVTVNRAPQWDALAPKGPDARALLDDGWELDCSGCTHRLSSDGCEECGDPAPEIITEGDKAWCSFACRSRDVVARLRRTAKLAMAKAEVQERWPSVTDLDAYMILDGDVEVARVDFRFPGGQGLARWQEGREGVMVEARDLDAWRAQ